MSLNRLTLALVAATLTLPAGADAQDLHPSRRPSPLGLARTTVGETYIKVHYGRPYQRGRDNIFGTKESGALVPFGEVWRTGANEATEITITNDVTVAGKELPAGTYTLFTTPGAETWQVHFNSKLGMSGTGMFQDGKFTPVDLAATNVLSVEVPVTTLGEDAKVDQFTIAFEAVEGGTTMVLRWIRTEVRVPIGAK
jgi:hypothetical protein